MEKALVDAIYYINGSDTYLNCNVVKEILYDGTQSDFVNTITQLNSDINVRTLFGNHDNICYQILGWIGKCYNQLLIGELDSLLIVTRHDNAIKIRKSGISNDEITSDEPNHNYDKNTGIIKIDAVLTELNISSLNKEYNWYRPLYWVGIFGIIVFFTRGYIKHPYPYKK